MPHTQDRGYDDLRCEVPSNPTSVSSPSWVSTTRVSSGVVTESVIWWLNPLTERCGTIDLSSVAAMLRTLSNPPNATNEESLDSEIVSTSLRAPSHWASTSPVSLTLATPLRSRVVSPIPASRVTQ